MQLYFSFATYDVDQCFNMNIQLTSFYDILSHWETLTSSFEPNGVVAVPQQCLCPTL